MMRDIKERETKHEHRRQVRGISNRSLSVRGVGCEDQEYTWMVIWGSILQEGQRELGISPIISPYEMLFAGSSLKDMAMS